MDMTVSSLVLLGLLGIASWSDLLTRKIPNYLVVCGLCLGLGINNAFGGLAGALSSAIGASVGLIVFLPFFALRWMGAGDVKLLAMVGSFVGAPAIVLVAIYTALAGGALGLGSQFLVRMGWVYGESAQPTTGVSSSAAASADGCRTSTPRRIWASFARSSFQLPYAIAITIGTALWLITRGA